MLDQRELGRRVAEMIAARRSLGLTSSELVERAVLADEAARGLLRQWRWFLHQAVDLIIAMHEAKPTDDAVQDRASWWAQASELFGFASSDYRALANAGVISAAEFSKVWPAMATILESIEFAEHWAVAEPFLPYAAPAVA